MVSVDLVVNWSWAQAIALAVFGLIYAGAIYYYDEFKQSRFIQAVHYTLLIFLTTGLLYMWLRAGGHPGVRWIAYGFDAVFMLMIVHTYMTCPPCVYRDKECEMWSAYYSQAYVASLTVMLLAYLMFGVIMVLTPGLPIGVRWTVYAFALVFMLFSLTWMFRQAVCYAPVACVSRGIYGLIGFTGLISLTYPVLFALSPPLGNVITANDEEFGYLLADIVTRVIFTFGMTFSLRKMCGQCTPKPLCAPEVYLPLSPSASTVPLENVSVYANIPTTPGFATPSSSMPSAPPPVPLTGTNPAASLAQRPPIQGGGSGGFYPPVVGRSVVAASH